MRGGANMRVFLAGQGGNSIIGFAPFKWGHVAAGAAAAGKRFYLYFWTNTRQAHVSVAALAHHSPKRASVMP